MSVTTICGAFILCTNLLGVPTEEVTVQSTYDSYDRQSFNEFITIADDIQRQRLEQQQRILQEEKTRLAQMFQGVNLSNLLHVSNITVEEMQQLLLETNLFNVAHVYVQAEKQYGVNAIVLASISALESGWGNSRRATQDGNLFGRDVIEPTSVGKIYKTTDNTIIDAQSISILDTAQHLKDNYLTENGVYHNGYGIESVNVKYCVNVKGQPTWSNQVSNIANRLLESYHTLPKNTTF